jgi:hypothetical protein
MNKNTEKINAFIDYLFSNHRQLWTEEETTAYDHFCTLDGMKNESGNAKKVRYYITKAWMTINADKATSNLLKDGFEAFKLNLTNEFTRNIQTTSN